MAKKKSKAFRMFGGKRFNKAGAHGTKSAAKKNAARHKKRGWNVRTSKDKDVKAKKGKHRVWVRAPD